MAKSEETVKAFAYLRTSSATNVGADKDSQKRQLAAIMAFAKRRGFEIVGVFKDDAVSGEDDISARPGFAEMLDALEANSTRTVILEDATRFARKLFVQEAGILALIEREVVCWAASGDIELTDTSDEMRVAMRQMGGIFAQLEKSRLVKKLKAARDRKRAANGKCEGRKAIHEMQGGAAVVELARRLHRRSPKTGKRRPLREIADELAKAGHVSVTGRPLSPSVVMRLVA